MIRQLKNIPGLRQVGRWYVNKFMEGTVTPIRSGYAKDMLWVRRRRYINSMWVGDYEEPMQQAIASQLRPGCTFYDIGANAGFFSLMAWKCIGPTGKVVSVDPDRANQEHMQELKKINKLDNWQLIQEGVDGQIGKLVFEYHFEGDSGGRLTGRQRFEGDNPTHKHQYEVPTTTFDALFERRGKPDVIKLDIEGSEYEAFKTGAEEMMSKHRPTLIMELHGIDRAKFVQSRLAEHRYELQTLGGAPAHFEHNAIFHAVAIPK